MNLVTLLLLILVGWLTYRAIRPSGKSRNKIAEEIARRMTEARAREARGENRSDDDPDAVNLQECSACGTYRDPASGPCDRPDCPMVR
jgi:ribosomal protein L32